MTRAALTGCGRGLLGGPSRMAISRMSVKVATGVVTTTLARDSRVQPISRHSANVLRRPSPLKEAATAVLAAVCVERSGFCRKEAHHHESLTKALTEWETGVSRAQAAAAAGLDKNSHHSQPLSTHAPRRRSLCGVLARVCGFFWPALAVTTERGGGKGGAL